MVIYIAIKLILEIQVLSVVVARLWLQEEMHKSALLTVIGIIAVHTLVLTLPSAIDSKGKVAMLINFYIRLVV